MALSNKREGMRLVGAYFPPQVSQYLTLYGLAKRTSKTDIIRRLIQDWMFKQRLENTETKLVTEIINRVKQDWEVYQKLYPERTLFHYKEKLRSDLETKKINESHIKRIIASI